MKKIALLLLVLGATLTAAIAEPTTLEDVVAFGELAYEEASQAVTQIDKRLQNIESRIQSLESRVVASIIATHWPKQSQTIAEAYYKYTISKTPTRDEMDYWREWFLDTGIITEGQVILHIIENRNDHLSPITTKPSPELNPERPEEKPQPPTDKSQLQIGNFLAEGGGWTSMVLMSDYLHNGTSPNRAASDVERPKIIKRARTYGNTFHVYLNNDDNYSRRRGQGIDAWMNIPDRRLFYKVEDFHHWYHWLAQVRDEDMQIVGWLWSNDARKTYNNEKVWTDDMVVEQMTKLIELGSTEHNGEPLITDWVLKLEADDEWSFDRINRIARRVKSLLPTGHRLWYHNQWTDIERMKQVDWSQFDGFRYQWMDRHSKEAFQGALRDTIRSLPQHLLWVGSEYDLDGAEKARQFGDWVLEMRAEFPQIIGVDNAATLSRWGGDITWDAQDMGIK